MPSWRWSAIPERTRRSTLLIVGVVFTLALGFRLIGLGWGLPSATRTYSLHPDEPINVAYAHTPEAAAFRPNFYNYGTLYLTATRLSGDLLGVDERARTLGPRLLNVLAGSLTAGLLALFFLRRGRPLAAWTAGLLTAFSTGLSVHARFATVDVLATALIVAGLVLASTAPSRGRLMGAAILIGLATACKYNMALGFLGLLVPITALPRETRFMNGLLAFAAFFATFLAGVPGIILEPAAFRRDFVFELLHSAQGHDTVFSGTAPGFLYQLGNLGLALGFAATGVGLLGLILAARRGDRWAWTMLLFAIPYFLLIGRAEVKFLRYCLPLVPLLAMGGGDLLESLRATAKGSRVAIAAAIALIGGLDGGGLVRSAPLAFGMASEDPRDAAGVYLKRVGVGKAVGLARDPWFWSASLYPEASAPRSVGPRRYFGWMAAARDPRVVRYIPRNEARADFDVRLFGEVEPDYVALSTLESAAAGRLSAQGSSEELAARYRDFMAILARDYVPDRIFGNAAAPVVEDLEYVRPTVTVWKRKGV